MFACHTYVKTMRCHFYFFGDWWLPSWKDSRAGRAKQRRLIHEYSNWFRNKQEFVVCPRSLFFTWWFPSGYILRKDYKPYFWTWSRNPNLPLSIFEHDLETGIRGNGGRLPAIIMWDRFPDSPLHGEIENWTHLTANKWPPNTTDLLLHNVW